MKKSLCLILLVLMLPLTADAQKKVEEADTVKVSFINGFDIHFDVVGAVMMSASDHGQWEGGVRINILDKYFPAVELGYGEADEKEDYVEESWGKAKGTFFRIGCDFNILKNKHDIYKLFAGFRYGFSKFSYDMSVGETVTTEDDPDTDEDESSTTTVYTDYYDMDATYHWIEFVLGADAKIWGPLHLGWDIRYRRRLTQTFDDVGAPWYIPGFGNQKKAGFTALFYINLSF